MRTALIDTEDRTALLSTRSRPEPELQKLVPLPSFSPSFLPVPAPSNGLALLILQPETLRLLTRHSLSKDLHILRLGIIKEQVLCAHWPTSILCKFEIDF